MIIVQHSKIFITTLQPLDILRLHSIPGTEKKILYSRQILQGIFLLLFYLSDTIAYFRKEPYA